MSIIQELTNAIENLNIDLFKKILKDNNKDLESILKSSDNDDSLLFSAINNKLPEVALALIATNQCNLDEKARWNWSLLYEAITSELPEVALALIATNQFDLQEVHHNGSSLLMLARTHRFDNVVRIIENPIQFSSQIQLEKLERMTNFGLTQTT